VKLLDEFNIKNVCWESDYPHSDSSWPNAPERLAELFTGIDGNVVDDITHQNAMRHYSFDPFAIRPRQQCTAEALRAEVGPIDTVTRAGRPADERDLEAWARLTRR
jgi:hypothetical protein